MRTLNKEHTPLIFKRFYSILTDIFLFGIGIYFGLKLAYGSFTIHTFALHFSLAYLYVNIIFFIIVKDRFTGEVFTKIKLVPLRSSNYVVFNILRIIFNSLLFFILFDFGMYIEFFIGFFSNSLYGAMNLSNYQGNSLITFTDKIFGSYYIEDKLILNSKEDKTE